MFFLGRVHTAALARRACTKIHIIVSKLGSNTAQGDRSTEPPTQCYQVEFSGGARITPENIKKSAEFNRMIEENT